MSITAQMGLTLPTVGVTSDATGNQNYIDNFSVIDVHDHSAGKGIPVPTAGLNINADLSFSAFKSFNVGLSQFTNLSGDPTAASNKPAIYVKSGELYFLDNNSNVVQLTNLGSVAGTSGSIGGLSSPATAQFSTNTFTWNTNGTSLAKMKHADILLYPVLTGATNFATIKVSNTVTSYTITLPDAAPGSTAYLSMTSGGVIATASADTIASEMTATGANAIRAISTRAAGTSVAAGGVATSASSGSFVTTSAVSVAVTNLSVTIVTSGRPVCLMLVQDGTATNGIFQLRNTTGAAVDCTMLFQFDRGGTNLNETEAGYFQLPGSGRIQFPGIAPYIDSVAAGTYTYTFEVASTATPSSSCEVRVSNWKLVAFEL